MRFTIDETGAANLFIAARGRGGVQQIDDRNALAALLRQFAMQGVMAGLEKSKDLFGNSSDSNGECKMGSDRHCDCFLCKIDEELLCIAKLREG